MSNNQKPPKEKGIVKIFPVNGPPRQFKLKGNGEIAKPARNFLAGHGGPAYKIPKQYKAFIDADNAGQKNIKKFGKPEKRQKS